MTWLSRLLRREGVSTPPSTPPSPPVLPAVRPGDYATLAAAMGLTAAPPMFKHEPYKPLKGVLPSAAMAQDESVIGAIDWANQAQGVAYGNALSSAFAEGMIFPGYPYLAELAQRPEYRRGAEIIATELTREWITLGSKKEGDDKAERIEALIDAMGRFKVRDKFRRVAELDGFMGRAQIFLDMGATNVATPLLLTPQTVKKGGLKALTVVEPMWSYPTAYNSINPLAPDFYRPPGWYVMGKEVSSTRLLTFIGHEVPDLLKPSYAFGGLSLTQMAKPYVDNWLRTRQAVSDLINNFSKVGIKTDLGAVMSGDCSPENFANRMAFFNLVRSNRGIMALDMTTEEMFELSTPLSGLNDLQSASLEQVCAVYGIPQVIYLQLAPGGLNTNSEGVIQVFYDAMKAKQEDYYRDPLQRVLDLLQLNEFGDIDPDITFSFNPLWQMSDKEKAEVRKINADTAAVYTNAGILDPVEERERLAAEGGGIYTNLDLSKEIEIPGFEEDNQTDIDAQEEEGGGVNSGGGEPALDAAWNESDHPRDDDGKFGSGGGGGASVKSKPLTEQQSIEAKDYKEGGYKALNSHLRNPDKANANLAAALEQTAHTLDKAIAKSRLTDDATLFRGMQHKALASGAEKLIGKRVPVSSFQSTSTDAKAASEFAGLGDDAVVWKIEAKAGSPALDLSQFETTNNKGESEFLLPRGGEMEVVSVDRGGRIPVITARFHPKEG